MSNASLAPSERRFHQKAETSCPVCAATIKPNTQYVYATTTLLKKRASYPVMETDMEPYMIAARV